MLGVLEVAELCVHGYLCTGCSKNCETVHARVYFVQNVLKVDTLCVHVFVFVQYVLKIEKPSFCVFISVQGVLNVEQLSAH
jgi:hypothetical protein